MKRTFVTVTILSWSLLFILLLTTNPNSISPAGKLGVFILVYVSLLGVVTFLLYYGSVGVDAVRRALTSRTARRQLTLRRSYLYASILAVLPMMLVSLHASGGLRWYEPVLVFTFGGIGVVYIARRV